MLSRKQAIVGWITFAVLRRLGRRWVRALARGGESVRMFGRGRSESRSGFMVAAARPIVTRAVSDPELHDALRQAFTTGHKVTVAVQGRSPRDAAREIGRDRKLQREIESSAQLLQSALGRVVSPPARKKRGRGSLVALVAATAAVIALAPLVLRRLRSDFS